MRASYQGKHLSEVSHVIKSTVRVDINKAKQDFNLLDQISTRNYRIHLHLFKHLTTKETQEDLHKEPMTHKRTNNHLCQLEIRVRINRGLYYREFTIAHKAN